MVGMNVKNSTKAMVGSGIAGARPFVNDTSSKTERIYEILQAYQDVDPSKIDLLNHHSMLNYGYHFI